VLARVEGKRESRGWGYTFSVLVWMWGGRCYLVCVPGARCPLWLNGS
jgi:hypothetical protein